MAFILGTATNESTYLTKEIFLASPLTAQVSAVKKDAIDAIGNTPLVDVSILSPDPKVQIFGKLESVNPTGSVKDRAARSLIDDAERKGLIKPCDTHLEPTSGNTGLRSSPSPARRFAPRSVPNMMLAPLYAPTSA